MNNMEELLKEEKKHIDALKTPAELELRLRKALDQVENKTNRSSGIWKSIVIAILLFLFVGYNFDAFAYYGKKIMGFDEVASSTLKTLNNEGMGQRVEKTVQLDNDTKLTINGIMADTNRTILYYTLANTNGLEEDYSDSFSLSKLTGFLTNSNYSSGEGIFNKERTEFKGIADFESVSPFSKKLTLHYWRYAENGQGKEEKISFSFDPAKAMQAELKQSIKKKVKVDQGTITFNSIIASPTLTVVKGTLNVKNFDRLNENLMGIELLANGKTIEIIGSSTHSSPMGGRTFEIQFDALSKDLQTLELNVKEFVGYKKINETFPLKTIQEKPYKISGESLWIKNVSTTLNGTEITIATKESILLDKVRIDSKNDSIPIKTTRNVEYVKQQNGEVMKERTLVFDPVDESNTMEIGGIHYMKQYNKKIQIPID
ncbi:DUF4179 domain-containing protein [Niallia sp. 03133]|uniref:DUF4179 domain-containing protein n=1 Tax=Niallia sp. 03133 TaxID=3458060 RepID=UPI0040440BEF